MKIHTSIIIIILIISALSLNSCKDKSSFKISGKITDAPSSEIVLEQLSPIKVKTIATASIGLNGKFEITYNDSIKRLYRLRIGTLPPIYLCLQNGEEVNIDASCNDITKYVVSGSDDCLELKRLNEHLVESTQKIEDLRSKVSQEFKLTNTQLEECNKAADELYESDKDFISEFIKANHSSPIAYFALHQYVSTTPIMQLETDYEMFKYVLDEMQKYNPELEETQYLKSAITRFDLRQEQINRDYEHIEIGSKAPEFTLCDENGQKHSLSDFKGNEICVCFWASWDKKSVKEIQTFISENTSRQIILISLDNNHDQWSQSIKFNRLENCINLCDLKSWEGITTKTYGIRSIPTIIEISDTGEISKITCER